MRFNKNQREVLHLGWSNPQQQRRLVEADCSPVSLGAALLRRTGGESGVGPQDEHESAVCSSSLEDQKPRLYEKEHGQQTEVYFSLLGNSKTTPGRNIVFHSPPHPPPIKERD